MSDARGQFTFYRSYWEALRELPNKDRLPILDALIAYALDGTEPASLTKMQAVVFALVRPTLDAGRKKAKNGKAGGSAKQTGSKPEAPGKQTPREKENEKERENEIEKEVERELDIRRTPKAPASVPAPPVPATPPPAPVEGKAFTAFWNAYPYKVSREDAWSAWCALNPQGQMIDRLMAALEIWKASERWQEKGGKFIPKAAKWLSEGYWESPPPRADSKPAKRQPDADEQAAIRRMLEGGTDLV